MRTLVFTDDEQGRKFFEYMFRGLIIGGNQNGQKGLSILKREISLLDKLEEISEPCECGRLVPGTKEPDRELREGGSTVDIDEQQYDLLYQYVSSVPWSIGESSRGAIKALDRLQKGKFHESFMPKQG